VLAKLVTERVLLVIGFEKVSLFLLNSRLLGENLLQLRALIAQLALINLFEEHRDVTHLPGFVELFGKIPFFLGSHHCPIAGRRPPAVMPDEYGVIALP